MSKIDKKTRDNIEYASSVFFAALRDDERVQEMQAGEAAAGLLNVAASLFRSAAGRGKKGRRAFVDMAEATYRVADKVAK